MSIMINWVNPNAGAFTVDIYRSTSEFTPQTLPSTALVNLTNSELSYKDFTAVPNTDYYYMVALTTANGTLYSNLRKYRMVTDSLWGDGVDDILAGDPSLVAYGGIVRATDFKDYVTNAIFSKLSTATNTPTEFLKIAINGRYFLVPRDPVSISMPLAKENNLLLGHRTPRLPAGVAPDILGTNDPFIYAGRKWSVGLPKLYLPDATANPANVITNFADEKGMVTFEKMRQSELTCLVVNMGKLTTSTRIPRAFYDAVSGNGYSVSCDFDFSATVASPLLAAISRIDAAGALTYATRALTTTSVQALPLIEYQGTI